MADSVALTVTGADGTVYTITGQLSNSIIAVVAPPPPAPTITAVQVFATAVSVKAGAPAQCVATVQGTGAFSSDVTWAASIGSIDASGLFIAPAVAGPAIITATSTQDASKSGSATIGVQAPPPPPPPTGAPVIPATTGKTNMLTPPNPWQGNHDAGTPGNASGTATYPVTAPDGTPNCLQLSFNTTAKGGMIYHGLFLKKGVSAYNRFAYRKRELKTDKGGWGTIGQCETDIEVTNPKTGIPYDLAVQQNANDGQVDVSINHKWTGTGVKANPTTRANGVWHESVEYWGFDWTTNQITCFGVEMNGVYFPINKTFTDPDNAVWGKDEGNLQLQYDSNQAASTDHVILISLLEVDYWKE